MSMRVVERKEGNDKIDDSGKKKVGFAALFVETLRLPLFLRTKYRRVYMSKGSSVDRLNFKTYYIEGILVI